MKRTLLDDLGTPLALNSNHENLVNDSPNKTFDKATFSTNDKGFKRIRKGNTIVIYRCKEIMRSLWMAGFKHGAIVTREDLEQHVFLCAGGDYRTIKKYIGFWVYSRGNKIDPPRPLKRMKGYLERLYYVFRVGNGKFQLNHAVVNSDYHFSESPLSEFNEGNQKVSIDKLCVCSGEVGGEALERLAKTTINKQTTTTHNTHTKNFQRSYLDTNMNRKFSDDEKRVLAVLEAKAKPKE